MYGTGITKIETQQAIICNYKNTRLKLLKTNGAICLTKYVKTKQLRPKHFSIKIK